MALYLYTVVKGTSTHLSFVCRTSMLQRHDQVEPLHGKVKEVVAFEYCFGSLEVLGFHACVLIGPSTAGAKAGQIPHTTLHTIA